MYIYIYIYTYLNTYKTRFPLSVREDLGTEYGVRLSTEIYGSKREKTVFRECPQEACFVLTRISESLRKPPGAFRRMPSRNPVLQFPLALVLGCPGTAGC